MQHGTVHVTNLAEFLRCLAGLNHDHPRVPHLVGLDDPMRVAYFPLAPIGEWLYLEEWHSFVIRPQDFVTHCLLYLPALLEEPVTLRHTGYPYACDHVHRESVTYSTIGTLLMPPVLGLIRPTLRNVISMRHEDEPLGYFTETPAA